MKNNNKYKVLVLSDLTDDSINVLQTATKVAQIIDGQVDLFHVRKATNVVKQSNQLAAMRAINDNYKAIEKELNSLAGSVSEIDEIKINPVFSFGNIKKQIENHIETTKPDIVVLGKRKSVKPALFGDKIIPFVLKKFKGEVLLIDKDTVWDTQALSVGLFNATDNVDSNSQFIHHVIARSEKPVRAFKVADKTIAENEGNDPTLKEVVSYIFEKNDDALKTISNYMSKNKVNLMFVDRKPSTSKVATGLSISELNNLIDNLKAPLLLSRS
ncbi:MAG TPA: hypothetical protein DEA82_12820 [Flavobacteriaceae bacterium]|nr:hypothetical protein [Flavobacteriaceae bacterium]MAY52058.1 hypothetical protein [Flavobacteriaceae bacterium]HBR55008.1 hypothetical protein [Flavobacteriaceae bacterium]